MTPLHRNLRGIQYDMGHLNVYSGHWKFSERGETLKNTHMKQTSNYMYSVNNVKVLRKHIAVDIIPVKTTTQMFKAGVPKALKCQHHIQIHEHNVKGEKIMKMRENTLNQFLQQVTRLCKNND